MSIGSGIAPATCGPDSDCHVQPVSSRHRCFFAFLARKLLEHFNESKFISTTVFSLCVVWIAFVPTFYILTTIEEGLQLQTFSLLVTIILSASITLCCLLIPKAFIVFSLKFRKETIDTVSGQKRKSSIITREK